MLDMTDKFMKCQQEHISGYQGATSLSRVPLRKQNNIGWLGCDEEDALLVSFYPTQFHVTSRTMMVLHKT